MFSMLMVSLLVIALWELLVNESFKFIWLLGAGLFACFHVTCCNLFFFSTVLVNFDYEIDWKLLESNKQVPMVILGFGTATSFVFIFIAMIKILGIKLTFFNIFPNYFVLNFT